MNARKVTIWMGMTAAILLAAGSAQAAIIGINTAGGTDFASINFNDTTSLTPGLVNGTTNATNYQSPWNGSSWTLGMMTDSITGDRAKGNLLGTCTPGTGTYAVSLNSITLEQLAPNTGYAHLNLSFTIVYELDGAGLAPQATLFPNFTVNGTVQNISTGFANFGGTIDYYGMNTAYQPYLLDTVTYAPPSWTTPGLFNGTVAGVPTFGTTPQLPGSVGLGTSTLTLVGNFSFMVDPATINLETVPEPATLSLLVLGGLALIRRR